MRAILLALFLLAPPAAAMEKEIVPICAHDQALCEELEAFVCELADLMPAPKKLSAARISALNARKQKDERLIDAVIFKEKMTDAQANKLFLPVVNGLHSGIYTLSLTVVPVALADLSKLLARQEKDLEKLAEEVDAAPQPAAPAVRDAFLARLDAVNRGGTKIWDHLQDNSLNVGRMGAPVYDEKDAKGVVRWKRSDAGQIIETSLNPLHERIGRLSRRIQETDAKLGGALAAAAAPQHGGMLKDGPAGKEHAQDPFSKVPAQPAWAEPAAGGRRKGPQARLPPCPVAGGGAQAFQPAGHAPSP